MNLSLEEIGRAIGSPTGASGVAAGYSIDTRTLQPGDLFFALRGERQDGHAYVAEALSKGAIAAVVDDERPFDGTVLRTRSVLDALQALAAWARTHWAGKIVAVTGSAGKTTTKDAIAAVLATRFHTGKTEGNFNNHVGLPLSLLRLPADCEVAVIEMGMNHAGEIRDLARIAKPDIGVVTNAGYAHIENFDTREAVASAKRELIESLPPDGIAILNADDPQVRGFRAHHQGRSMTFGLSNDADVRGEQVQLAGAGVRFTVDGVPFESSLTGRHGVRNILAALAAGKSLGLPIASMQGAVGSLAPGKMRGDMFTHAQITIINDCYNSNPDAAMGMLEVLRETQAARHIAVLGEMLELGRWAGPLHAEVGRSAAACGISVLIGIRGAARQMVDAALEAGQPGDAAFFFEDPVTAGIRLREIARPGDAILFKGSRGTRVEKALEEFLK